MLVAYEAICLSRWRVFFLNGLTCRLNRYWKNLKVDSSIS